MTDAIFDRVRLAVACLLVVSLTAPAVGDGIARRLTGEGDEARARGDHAVALERYRAAIDADPDMLDPYLRAFPLWLEAEGLDEAARYFERGASRHPEWPQLWYSLAYVYRRQHRTDAALGAYAEYVRLRPTDPAPYFGMAILEEEVGNVPAAIVAYRRYRLLEIDPARSDFRRQARRAVARLAPWQKRWQEHVVRLFGDGADAEGWRAAVKLVRKR